MGGRGNDSFKIPRIEDTCSVIVKIFIYNFFNFIAYLMKVEK